MPLLSLRLLLATASGLVLLHLHFKVIHKKIFNDSSWIHPQISSNFIRLLLYKHHILDVLGGVVVGFLEVLVMALIWVGPETASSLVSWISSDRIAGNDAEII